MLEADPPLGAVAPPTVSHPPGRTGLARGLLEASATQLTDFGKEGEARE